MNLKFKNFLQNIFSHARPNSRKALFLITDGFSNGGDPRNVAKALKSDGVTIFTFGVQNGNIEELFEMASTPEEEHCFILDSFDEFVALARRALHRGNFLYNHHTLDESKKHD